MKYFLTLVFLGCINACFAQPGKGGVKDSPASNLDKEGNTRSVDSLKHLLKDADQSQLFEIQFGLFRELILINKDSSSFYLSRALKQALFVGDSLNIVYAYNAQGSLLKSGGNIIQAIKIYEKALKIARRNDFRKPIKFLLNNLALSYTLTASYDTALTYNFESLKVRESDGDAKDIYIALNNIGYLYEELGDNENALLYYSKGYSVKVENNVAYDLDMSLINIARTLNSLEKYVEAELRITQAFNICNNSECRPENLISAYQVMGVSLFKQKKYDLSRFYFNKSLKLSMKYEFSGIGASSIDSKSECYYWLALIKFYEGGLNEAINYLNSSQEVAITARLQKQVLKNYELYSKIYFVKRNFEKAFDYQNKFQQLNSDILNLSVLKRISKIHAEYSARESATKIESQEKILKLQKETIDQHKSLNYLIGMVAILTFGLALIFFKMNREKQISNKILDLRVKERTLELEKNRDELKHSHDSQAIVLRKVSNDLTSSLATLRGLSQIAVKSLSDSEAFHFNEAVIASERIVNYVKQHTPGDAA